MVSLTCALVDRVVTQHADEHPDERLPLGRRQWGEELVLNLGQHLVER